MPTMDSMTLWVPFQLSSWSPKAAGKAMEVLEVLSRVISSESSPGSSFQLPGHHLRSRAHIPASPCHFSPLQPQQPHPLPTQHLLFPPLLNPLSLCFCTSLLFPCCQPLHLDFSSELINAIMFSPLERNGISRIQWIKALGWRRPLHSRSPVVLQCSGFPLSAIPPENKNNLHLHLQNASRSRHEKSQTARMNNRWELQDKWWVYSWS